MLAEVPQALRRCGTYHRWHGGVQHRVERIAGPVEESEDNYKLVKLHRRASNFPKLWRLRRTPVPSA